MDEINLNLALSRARNSEHYQFHKSVLGIITSDFADAQDLSELRAAYLATFDTEDAAYLRNLNFKDTPEIEAADKKRDDLFNYTSQTTESNKLCPIEAKKAAAMRFDFVIHPYVGASRLPQVQNTAAVSDFVEKALLPEHAADLQALGLTEIIPALKAANDAFDALYNQRNTEDLSRATADNMKTIRPKVDEAYREIGISINALYRVNALVTKNAAKEQALGTAIGQINGLVIGLQKTLSKAGVGPKQNFSPPDKNPPASSGSGGSGEKPDDL